MTYLYWSLTLSVMTIFLLIVRNIPYLTKRTLHIAWRILLLRALFQFQIPSIISIYNVINHQLDLKEEAVQHIQFSSYSTTKNLNSTVLRIKADDVFHILMVLGIVLFIVLSAMTILKCRSIIKNSVPFSSDICSLNKPLSRKITVLSSTQVNSPMACNFLFKAYIVMPAIFKEKRDTALILEHEYMHIKHNDSFWKMLSLFVVCIHWFNPVVWIIYHYYKKDIEIATDEDVISTYGWEYRSQYANALIDISSEFEPSHLFTAFKGNSIIKERVINIMGFRNVTRYRTVLTLLVVGTFTICFATNSFASLAARKPIIPEPYEVIMTEEEYLSASFPEVDKPEVVTLSLESKNKVGQHDIVPDMIVVYDNDNNGWNLKAGETKTLQLRIANRNFPYGQQVEIGYIFDGQEQTMFASQIKSGVDVSFEAQESGFYQFFVSCRSSHTILVDSFCIK